MSEATPDKAQKRLAAFGGDPRALNALKHGLTSKRVLAEEESAYYSALQALQEDYAAQTAYQTALLRRLARLIVRLERAAMVDASSFAAIFPGEAAENAPGPGFNRLAFEAYARTVAQYEMAIGRALVKVAHELERLGCSKGTSPERSPIVVDFNW